MECKDWFLDSDYCPSCSSPDISPQWQISLTIQNSKPSKILTLDVRGPVFDPLMAMTVDEYLDLVSHYGDLSSYVQRFFEWSCFNVGIRDRDLLAISPIPGSQLTFLNWLGLQPNFEIDELFQIVMGYEKVSNLSDTLASFDI
jgi:RNA polymerase subunit RPABC4/transcription elongation factor Spt4